MYTYYINDIRIHIMIYIIGMMDELKPQVKKGLVDLIFGIYENDAKEVCDALENIEVLRRGIILYL